MTPRKQITRDPECPGPHRIARPRWALIGLGAAALLLSTPARAWDPSTTHQRILETAVSTSPLHLRWMESSGLEQGVFSPLQLDPAQLTSTRVNQLVNLQRRLHADSGAVALGGPGACPSASAPIETQRYCVRGDVWEMSGLGWLRLGALAESRTATRMLHHFSDLSDPQQPIWRARDMSNREARRFLAGSVGQPGAGRITDTNFAGAAASASHWLADADDELAPPATFAHMQRAVLELDPSARQQARVLALMGLGALLHVAQDLSLPSHARGDLRAFTRQMARNSTTDLGLAANEFARTRPGLVHAALGSGQALDLDPALPPSEQLEHWSDLLVDSKRGIAAWAARHFLSAADFTGRHRISETASPAQAAADLLGDDHGLVADEVESARLSSWPAHEGYLLSSGGRPLAAFTRDRSGLVRLDLDETCLRELLAQALPRATAVSVRLLDLVWPAFPEHQLRTRNAGESYELVMANPSGWTDTTAVVFSEDSLGRRTALTRLRLRTDGRKSVVPVAVSEAAVAAGTRVVVALVATNRLGVPVAIDQRVAFE